MVIRLTRPDVDDVDLIRQVVAQRQNGNNRGYFSRIEEDWKQRVREYLAHSGNPEAVARWQAAVRFKTRFLTLYNSPQEGAVQKPILQKLRERTIQYCPACGEDGTPNTLDHYLPKNDYPDFAITASNLFPMCDTCQGWKLEQTLDEHGRRRFLHPYFDEFLDQQVLCLEIGRPFSAPRSMELLPCPDLPQRVKDIVSRHIDALGIVNRYSHFFRDEYVRLLRSAADIREEGLDIQQQIRIFRNRARRKAINSWGHIFYDSVLRNGELLRHLQTAELPELEDWALVPQ
jgi:5-methylcytosine-specific restriction endonuclease McrA